MKQIFNIQKIYALSGETVQIRVRIFNRLMFRISFKTTFKPV
ncbi:hypothetical protein [Flavobacterium sp. ALJ2]|nr:hypothetical protein [Flavobacterium sp. ALJ2]